MKRDFRVAVFVLLLIPAAHGFTQRLPPTHLGGTPDLAAESQSTASLPSGDDLGVVEDQAELETTIKGYTEAIQRDPKNAELWIDRGSAWYHAGEYNKAIPDYTEAIRLAPSDTTTYYFRARTFYYLDEFDQAIADYSKVIQLDPNDADAYVERGEAWQAKADLVKAFADYDRAIQLDPNHAGAYAWRGNIWHERSEFDKAIVDYSRAIRLSPDDPYPYIKRGDAWCEKADFANGIKDFTKAIQLDGNDAFAYSSRAAAWSHKGEQGKAIADYTEAIRIDPQDVFAYVMRGEGWGRLGQTDKAMADYNEAIRIDPNHFFAYCKRGDTFHALGQDDKAIEDYNRALKLNPTSTQTYAIRGTVWDKQGQHDKAIADFSEAIRLDPDESSYYLFRGNMWLEKVEFEKAVADYNEAIRIDPNNAQAYYRRGLMWHQLGRTEKANADFAEASRLEPKLADVVRGVPGASAETQDSLAEISFDLALSVAPEILARGYLAAQSSLFAAHLAELGTIVRTTLDGRPVVLNQDNVAAYLPALQRRLQVIERAIRKRGFQNLPPTYLAKVIPGCKKSWVLPGPSLIDQSAFKITLTQSNMVHHGVIVESTVVFEHALDPEITIFGHAKEDQLICEVEHRGWAAAQEADCKLVLRQTERVDRAFATTYLGRGSDFLDNAEFGRAMADLNESIRLDPNLPLAFATRSRILSSAPDAKHRDGQHALKDATHACELTLWKAWQCLPALAAAHAENGDFPSAIRCINNAIELAPQFEHKELEDDRDLYRQRKPMRLEGRSEDTEDPSDRARSTGKNTP